jgi:hypothetical protein
LKPPGANLREEASGRATIFDLSTSPQGITESGGSLNASGDSRAKDSLRGPYLHGLFGTGNARIKKFSCQYRGVPVRQKKQELVKLRSLALMNGHGVYGLVLRQSDRMDLSESAVWCREKNAQVVVRFGVWESYAHISIKQAKVVVISRNQDRTTGIPLACRADEPFGLERLFGQHVQGNDAIGTFSEGAKDSEPFKEVKNLFPVLGLQVVPVPS